MNLKLDSNTNKILISKHITYQEAVHSDKAIEYNIDNIPSEDVVENMMIVAERCFEPIREFVGNKIYISSFYRCDELNKKVKGKKNSNHTKGYAIDMDFNVYKGKTNKEVFNWCKKNLKFDELLWEGGYNGWIHISYISTSENRQYVGTIPKP